MVRRHPRVRACMPASPPENMPAHSPAPSDRRRWMFALGLFAWMMLTVAGWFALRPIAASRTVEFTLRGEPGSVWALEWTRASTRGRNGVWIVLSERGEGDVVRRLPAYQVASLELRAEPPSTPARVDVVTFDQSVFGMPLGRVNVVPRVEPDTIVIPLPEVPNRLQVLGVSIVGVSLGLVFGGVLLVRTWWRAWGQRFLTPETLAWSVVGGVQAWMLSWSPTLYCPDSMGYLAGAIRLIRERSLVGFEGPRVPGFGVLLAALWVLPGDFSIGFAIIQSCLTLGTTFFAWRVAMRLMPRALASVVLVLVGLSPLMLAWQRFVMSETLSAYLVTLAVWLAMRSLPIEGSQGSSPRTNNAEEDAGFGREALGACVLGVVCAAGAYTRGNLQLLFVFVPVLFAAASWRRWGVGGAPALGAIALTVSVACVLPRAMWNLREYGEAKLVVGEGYQRNLTTQMVGLMEDNQSGVLAPSAWQALERGRREGTIDAYSAHDIWMKSERLHAPAGLKGWGERSAKLDVPAMESIAREPVKAAKVAALGTLNILGLWRTERWGFAENEYWSRPLRGVHPGTVERDGLVTNMWTGREIVEGMVSLRETDRDQLWTRTNRDITRQVQGADARRFAAWWCAEDALRPILGGLFVCGAMFAFVRRDGPVLVISALVAANATALAVLTLSGIDRYGVPFEPLLRVVAVYGAWRAWPCAGDRHGRSELGSRRRRKNAACPMGTIIDHSTGIKRTNVRHATPACREHLPGNRDASAEPGTAFGIVGTTSTSRHFTVIARNARRSVSVSIFRIAAASWSHLALPRTPSPRAWNLTPISSAVIGSRGSPLGTSTRLAKLLPSVVVMVTRLGWNLGKRASNSSLATTLTLSMTGIRL